MHTSTLLLFGIVYGFFHMFSCAGPAEIVTGIKTGNRAPEILCEGTDITGTCKKLSDLRGSYVLLEFWSSSCSQCIKDHFEMERMYFKHRETKFENGKGLEIYSVALEDNTTNWLNVLKEDRMSWEVQYCDTRKWNAAAALTYQVNSIPRYFLLDGDGVILDRTIQIPQLEAILASYVD